MTQSALPGSFIEQSTAFLQALLEWERKLPTVSWQELRLEAEQGRVALVSVDMLNGFCYEGALASPRVRGIIPAVVEAFEQAHTSGVRDFVLAQDYHTPDAVEFADFPPHCQAGTLEAETIAELSQLPFANLYNIVPKNSLSAFHGTGLGAWFEGHRNLSSVVVVGNCTDLCVHQMALHLKLNANAHNQKIRVIVPANAVQTYDLPLATAEALGALPHDGDFMHLTFLYHLRLNGVEVVHALL